MLNGLGDVHTATVRIVEQAEEATSIMLAVNVAERSEHAVALLAKLCSQDGAEINARDVGPRLHVPFVLQCCVDFLAIVVWRCDRHQGEPL